MSLKVRLQGIPGIYLSSARVCSRRKVAQLRLISIQSFCLYLIEWPLAHRCVKKKERDFISKKKKFKKIVRLS